MKKLIINKLSLTTKIFIALIAGIMLGLAINYIIPRGYFTDTIIVEGVLYVAGQGFIRFMQFLVVPLIMSSLVCGSLSIGEGKTLGKVGIRVIAFYFFTTAVAIVVAILVAFVVNPGTGLDMEYIQEETLNDGIEKVRFADTILNFIPSNIFASLSEGTILQIIVFALFLGIVLAKTGRETQMISKAFIQFNVIMMEMTLIIMKFAPVGVFCLIARTFANTGFGAIKPLTKYVVAVFIALAIQCFIVYLGLLKAFTGLSPVIFIRKFISVMEFAFSTASSNSTIPMSIEVLEEKMGVNNEISSFTVPLGATINMDGTAIMQGVAVVFVSQAFNISLKPEDYLTVIGTAILASIGTAGIPSVGLISLTMVFGAVNLPVEGIAMIMGIDRIIDMARTAVNVTGDAVCTTIVASQNNDVDRDIFYRSADNGQK